ncbi:hypothetical protein CK203_061577 [Vitis vinifera]|uniref:Reverse transcriptase domain-containing protein n=1 Tax=Vitis vinifera TaxID=29760 RepID=A0A438G9K1_VITVI|nr:hypothetical protein CK203_061577 [Vitis vinifera]
MWLKVDGFKDMVGGKVISFGSLQGLCIDQISYWDGKEREGQLSLEDMEAGRLAVEEFYWAGLEETSWRQKSWEAWLKEGGKKHNFFFHKMVNARHRRNVIGRIKINGEWVMEETEVSTKTNYVELEEVFTKKEVFDVLMDLNEDKALGHDGFSLAFWQHCGAEDLKEFRPISLLGSLNKILVKALANRSHRGGVVCKLDIEKAYDYVNWTSLLEVIRKIDFGYKGFKTKGIPYPFVLVMEALSFLLRTTMEVIRKIDFGYKGFKTKGIPYPFVLVMEALSFLLRTTMEVIRKIDFGYKGFKTKGIPYPFVLVMEALSFLLRMTMEGGFISCFRISFTYMAWVFLWFEATLRLRINSIKSELIPIRDVSNVEELASVFGCEVGKFPATDLGLPLGAPFKSKVDWDVVEKRFFKRLPLWKS